MNIFTPHIPAKIIDGDSISKTCGFSPKEIAEGAPNPLRVACALAKLDPDCDQHVWLHRRAEPLIAAAWLHPQYKRAFRYLATSWTFGQLHGQRSMRGHYGMSVMDEIEEISARLQFSASETHHGIGAIYFDAAQAERAAEPDPECSMVARVDHLITAFANL